MFWRPVLLHYLGLYNEIRVGLSMHSYDPAAKYIAELQEYFER